MPNDYMAPHETSSRANTASARLRYELREMLGSDRSRGGTADVSPDLILGLLIGLLIVKWADPDESQRELWTRERFKTNDVDLRICSDNLATIQENPKNHPEFSFIRGHH